MQALLNIFYIFLEMHLSVGETSAQELAGELNLAWTYYRSNSAQSEGRGSNASGAGSSSSSSPRIGRPSTSSLPPEIVTSPINSFTRPDTPQSPLVNNVGGISSTASTPTDFGPSHTNMPLGITYSVPLPTSSPSRRYTPPASHVIGMNSSNSNVKGKFPTTPPPQKRNKLYPDPMLHPLTKSVSHESQLSVKVNSATLETDR